MKIPYGKQWISDEDIEKVISVLKSDYLTTGPFIQEFENEFAKYVGAKYAVAVANGTAALHIAAQAAGVKHGSEVITTPMSFAATANCVLYNDGKPVFVDITERGLIDPQEISAKITKNTVGLIPVHYTGLPSEMDSLSEIAREHNLFLIEDACHALGAKYRSNKIGNCKYSDMAVFSFHPVKHITTGEGGIITTNNEEIFNTLSLLRTHGITKDKSRFITEHREPWFQEMQFLGFNYRLTEIQSALGLSQLSRVDEFVEKRRELAERYSDFFENMSDKVETIPETENEFHSYHLYVIKLKNPKQRQTVFENLAKRGIYCQIHYIPIYWHPFYRQSGYLNVKLDQTERFYECIISLPMYPSITDDEFDYVLESLKETIK